MTEDNNSLDDLISGVRAQQRKPGATTSRPKTAPKKGLTPFELLDLPEVQRGMAARIPASCLELCPGYGHFNDMENPAYEECVERHLQAVFGPAPCAKGSSPD